MGAITMVLITSLKNNLSKDYPQFLFEQSDSFYWDPVQKTIYYRNSNLSTDKLSLIHELSHGILNHNFYDRDIQLIEMERDAWELAVKLAKHYKVTLDTEFIESSLDTYRDWLHSRSICPRCGSTGVQTNARTYNCPSCGSIWRSNEARTCQLRRYIVKNKTPLL